MTEYMDTQHYSMLDPKGHKPFHILPLDDIKRQRDERDGVVTATMLSMDVAYGMGKAYYLKQFIDDMFSAKIVVGNLDKRLAFVARTEHMPDAEAVKLAVLEELSHDTDRRDLIDQVYPGVRRAMRLDFAVVPA